MIPLTIAESGVALRPYPWCAVGFEVPVVISEAERHVCALADLHLVEGAGPLVEVEPRPLMPSTDFGRAGVDGVVAFANPGTPDLHGASPNGQGAFNTTRPEVSEGDGVRGMGGRCAFAVPCGNPLPAWTNCAEIPDSLSPSVKCQIMSGLQTMFRSSRVASTRSSDRFTVMAPVRDAGRCRRLRASRPPHTPSRRAEGGFPALSGH